MTAKNIQYRHLRPQVGGPKGGITIGLYEEDGNVKLAVAVCSKRENYKKATGRSIVQARLTSQDEKDRYQFPIRGDLSLNQTFLAGLMIANPRGTAKMDLAPIGIYPLVDPLSLDSFEGVKFTNETFGNKTLIEAADPDAFWGKLKNQHKITQEELDEIADAIVARDFKMLRDGVCDVEVTNMGIAHIAGIDLKTDMQKVLVSNLSKVCKTQEDADATIKHYAETEGITVVSEPCTTMPGFIIKVPTAQVSKSGKNYPQGKFLKCVVGFREPEFA